MLIQGSPEEKLKWSFKLYDKDKDGAITRSEMLEIMQAVYKMSLAASLTKANPLTVEECTNRIFSRLDKDRNGKKMALQDTEFMATLYSTVNKNKETEKLVSAPVSPIEWFSRLFPEKKQLETRLLHLFDDVGQGPTLGRIGIIAMSDQVRHRTAKG
ncbi:UNVERIFIED_CONTAM: hypothetical protein FKN15_029185 [Acipenser sinensis]